MGDKGRSVDLLGIKPVSKAVEIATKGTVDGLGSFLSRICLPAAEEFGLLLRDRISSWRQDQAASIIRKAEAKLAKRMNAERLHAHPRLVMLALEQGSWNDADEVQEAWAGLLASACDGSGQSQENLIFMNLLAQMTAMEVHLLNYMCFNTKKFQDELGFVVSNEFKINISELCKIAGTDDIISLDIQLDHLRKIGLVEEGGGFWVGSNIVNIEPSALALNLYVRAQGSIAPAVEYFGPLEPLPLHMRPSFGQMLDNDTINPSDEAADL
ncbi:Abi-alpha family protein [Sphingobium sp.]|uniref:Abi-alpha family protein n=1 Tax=Sphingobium sp. TaxID=1912891 RepID=UPI0025F9FC51|nr:Abi-alpha family protein [Sphingobium sp.]